MACGRMEIYPLTEIKVWQCDSCGYTSKQDDPNMTIDQEIKLCFTCDKDFCGQCAEDHAKDETGLVWK